MKIRKAVIPAAGLGTRFLPATKAIPKEMIPIIDKPMIQFIVEEAVRSGIEEIILITARGKESIERHFSPQPALEAYLASKDKPELVELSRQLGSMVKITPVIQEEALGLGHAVLCAERAVGGEPFAVLLGDDMIDGDPACTKQLIDIFEQNGGTSVLGVMEVPREETKKYGIVGGPMLNSRLMHVTTMVEKPQPSMAPSLLACPGRYILTPTIFDHIRGVKPGALGEIQLTDALAVLAQKEKLLAYQFTGTRYDTGDRLGYLDATIAFALRRPDIGAEVKKLLKKHLGILALGALSLLAPWRAHAVVPPSQYLVKQFALKHDLGAASPKALKLKSTVTMLDGEKVLSVSFKQISLIDLKARILRSTAIDDLGRALFIMERKFDSDAESLPLASRMFLDGSVSNLTKSLKIFGIPVRTEAELAAMPTEVERREVEAHFVARYKGGYSWGIGLYKTLSPQLWIEKDTFLPQRLVMKFTDGIREVRYENYKFYREFPIPRMITVLKPEGKELSESLVGAQMREELTDVAINPELSELKTPSVALGMTTTGESLDSNHRDLLNRYYSAVR